MKKTYIRPTLTPILFHSEPVMLGTSGGEERLPANGEYGEEQLSAEREFEETTLED